MPNEVWQIWMHKKTHMMYAVPPQAPRCKMKHPTTRQWVDAVQYYRIAPAGEQDASLYVRECAEFREKFEFIRQINEDELFSKAAAAPARAGRGRTARKP